MQMSAPAKALIAAERRKTRMTYTSLSVLKPALKNAKASPRKSVLTIVRTAGTSLGTSKSSTRPPTNMLSIQVWHHDCKGIPTGSPDSYSLLHRTRSAHAALLAAAIPSERRCGKYTRSMTSRSVRRARSATKPATPTGSRSTLGGKAWYPSNQCLVHTPIG